MSIFKKLFNAALGKSTPNVVKEFGDKASARVPLDGIITIEDDYNHYRHGPADTQPSGWRFRISVDPKHSEMVWKMMTGMLKGNDFFKIENHNKDKSMEIENHKDKSLVNKLRSFPWHITMLAGEDRDGNIEVETQKNVPPEIYGEMLNLIEKRLVQKSIPPKPGVLPLGKMVRNSAYVSYSYADNLDINKRLPVDNLSGISIEKECLHHQWHYDRETNNGFFLPLVNLRTEQAQAIRNELRAMGIAFKQTYDNDAIRIRIQGRDAMKFHDKLYYQVPEYKKHNWQPVTKQNVPMARIDITDMDEDVVARIRNHLTHIRVASFEKQSSSSGRMMLWVEGPTNVTSLSQNLFTPLDYDEPARSARIEEDLPKVKMQMPNPSQ